MPQILVLNAKPHAATTQRMVQLVQAPLACMGKLQGISAGEPTQFVPHAEALTQHLRYAIAPCAADGAEQVVIGRSPLGQPAKLLKTQGDISLIAPAHRGCAMAAAISFSPSNTLARTDPMKTTLRRLSMSVLALAALTVGSAHASAVLEKIQQTKKVRIAIPTDYPPYGMVGLDMKPQGLDIDMAQYVANKLGAKLELVPVVSANRVPYLQTGKVDLVISTLGKTEERAKVVDFSHSYSPFFQALFAPQNMAIKDWSDLKGKTVSVTRGAMADSELTKVVPAGTEIRRFEDHIGTVSAYVSGQVQAIATSAGEGDAIQKQAPKLGSELKLILKVSPNYIGVNKGETALLERINAIVLEAKQSGELDRLSKKWLKQPAGDLPL